MKKLLFLYFLLTTPFSLKSQGILSLDSCRALAIANNKELLISGEKINAAHYQKKAAFTNYLPTSPPQELTAVIKRIPHCLTMTESRLSGLGTSVSGPLQQAAQVIGQLHPELAPMLSQLGGAIVPALNEAGTAIVDAFRTDTRNVYAGAITLTQPLYMGGKIRAYNKITKIRRRTGSSAT